MHPAFARTIETSVYVAPDAARAGAGSSLYGRLFADLADEGLHRAVVGIALPNEASIAIQFQPALKFASRESPVTVANGSNALRSPYVTARSTA